MVENNLKNLKQEMDQICRRVNRDVDEVGVLAVSKKQSLASIRQAFESGQRVFGESYVQEALPKINQLENLPLSWHFVGPLQSNKVRKMVGLFDLIHSVDRVSLMREISRQCEHKKIVQNLLLQVNLAEEPTKSGAQPRQVEELVAEGLKLPGLSLRGLMVMPPQAQNPEDSRPYFAKLHRLLIDIRSQFFKNKEDAFKELSMGTSQDYEVAIEEGATWIRLGTQLFGPREVAE